MAKGYKNKSGLRKNTCVARRITPALLKRVKDAIDNKIIYNKDLSDEVYQVVSNILLTKVDIIWSDEMLLPGEEWLPIKDFENYMISNKGRVRSLRSNQLLRIQSTTFGHKYINLSKSGLIYTILVHILVISAFKETIPFEGAQCLHLDNDPANNEPCNLKWGTHLENMQQCVRDGRRPPPPPLLHPTGADHPNAIPCYKYDGLILIKSYNTIIEAALDNKIPKTSLHRKMRKEELINGFYFTLTKKTA